MLYNSNMGILAPLGRWIGISVLLQALVLVGGAMPVVRPMKVSWCRVQGCERLVFWRQSVKERRIGAFQRRLETG